jgi:hypothetical protein
VREPGRGEPVRLGQRDPQLHAVEHGREPTSTAQS